MAGKCLDSLSRSIGHMLVGKERIQQGTGMSLSETSVQRDARVMWDQRSGRSKGFSFVSFRNNRKLRVQSLR